MNSGHYWAKLGQPVSAAAEFQEIGGNNAIF
jgi:hypothetical protein